MKVKMTSNFSWIKLIKFIQRDQTFNKAIDKYITKPIIEDSKEKIRSNQVTPATTPATLAKRRARKFPPTISDSTLYDTGKLHDSIRIGKTKEAIVVGSGAGSFLRGLRGIEMEKYGYYHQIGKGRNKKREFINLTVKSADKASSELMSIMVGSWKKKLAK